MMRAAALIVCLLCRQDAGPELFKKLEKKLSTAKSISLKFKGQMSAKDETADISGSLRLKPGDKYVFVLNMVRGDDKHVIEARSDGKKVASITDGKTSEEPVKPGVGRFLAAVLSRTGFMIAFMSLNEGGKAAPIPDPDEALKVSGVGPGPEGAVKGVKTLKFKVAVKGLSEIDVTLHVDAEKLVPVKIETKIKQGDEEISIVETFEEFSTDEIPDSEFELKK